MTELPHYHFDRDDFVRVWQGVLDDSDTDNVLDMCDVHTITDNFEMWRDEEEYYVKYLPNGVTINWYKGTHLGRTNTCTDPNFTLDDFEKFLVQLKHDIIAKSTENQKYISDMKIYSDMKLIKDAINDPNKNGFDICRHIKSITDEYNFKEEEE